MYCGEKHHAVSLTPNTAHAQGAYEVSQAWQLPAGELTACAEQSTAVVAALSFWDYSLVTPLGAGSDTYKATGRCFSVAAGRISFVHGFKGAVARLSLLMVLMAFTFESSGTLDLMFAQ